jgi:hypothetical protein
VRAVTIIREQGHPVQAAEGMVPAVGQGHS